ncbi:MAG: dephospho-CoA kinase [Tessaracoccus sp.]|uniref:dephospho-CoA kinase n=1 Tax=Tessaracoccus sp. TaxID=1971211 RepID=UPI001EC7F35C|nr:dephospho-CoA kinase [Tessaracoccus sp.]
MSRIIAGSAKGRRIATPKGAHTRPTTDRTREALFSALASWFDTADEAPERQLDGVGVLDLFAGSGAVGLEAASRGAHPVVLVESDGPTAKLIAANARDLRLRADVRAARAETVAASPGHRFDLVFLDPPYDLPTLVVESILASLVEHALAQRALVVVERSARDRPPVWPAALTETWSRDYGETKLYFGALPRRPRVALTGGIASGKSFVADELARRGAVIIDADLLAREVVEPGTPGLAAVVARFGEDVLKADGTLDRPKLGEVIFADDAARADLNAIVHPRVRARAQEMEDEVADGVVVHVIPLLVEAGLVDGFDTVLVVDLPVEEQIVRLMARNGVTRAQAEARVRAQATREERLHVADRVVDNSGDPASTVAQIDEIWTRLHDR